MKAIFSIVTNVTSSTIKDNPLVSGNDTMSCGVLNCKEGLSCCKLILRDESSPQFVCCNSENNKKFAF